MLLLAMTPAGPLASRTTVTVRAGAASYGPTINLDGWIEYGGSLIYQLGIPTGLPTLVPGRRDATGSCVFETAAQTVQPGELGVFSEDVAFNPATCDRKVVTVRLTAAGAARLDELDAQSERFGTTTLVWGTTPATPGR